MTRELLEERITILMAKHIVLPGICTLIMRFIIKLDGKKLKANNAQNGIKVDLTYTNNPDYPNDRSKDIVSGISVYVNKNSNNDNQVTSNTNSRGLKVTLEAGKEPVRQEAKY